MDYKREEIQEHFNDWINDQEQEWINDNIDDLHYHAFNCDYYIIGTYKAKQWCGDEVFNIIEFICDYEKSLFGMVSTDFSNPEAVVNMYAYIIGEEIVSDYVNELEVA